MNYIAGHGDIIMMDCDPSLGHEQKGKRPALVSSGEEFNFLAISYLMTITSKINPEDKKFILMNFLGLFHQ
ncbi:MAG: type II toxin-antitoxin system PemK/MazF family toxin [Saprospiraceae bacterium]|nr:type II toxin-antitoxin system PemK/MazF family toxin [Saprospiraceae bacterium]